VLRLRILGFLLFKSRRRSSKTVQQLDLDRMSASWITPPRPLHADAEEYAEAPTSLSWTLAHPEPGLQDLRPELLHVHRVVWPGSRDSNTNNIAEASAAHREAALPHLIDLGPAASERKGDSQVEVEYDIHRRSRTGWNEADGRRAEQRGAWSGCRRA
jgi:hypothetical protein